MELTEQNYLEHYGTPRHSGRYPWGSGGDNPKSTHHDQSFLDIVDDLKKKGLTETQIYEGMGITSTEYRTRKTLALAERRQDRINTVTRLRDKGMGPSAISRQTGIPEPTVRSLLDPAAQDRLNIINGATKVLKKAVDDKKYVEVGTGVEVHLGIKSTQLKAVVKRLELEGYTKHTVPMPQTTTRHDTKMLVLAKPGVTQREVFLNRFKIQLPFGTKSLDGGRTWGSVKDPLSINPNRVLVRYKEDGGDQADGVIYVRPGVEDVSLGNARYAQVRVLVNGTHYMKGMAIYNDEHMPKGIDLIFNTNKSSTGNKLDAMKPITDNPDFPFGSFIEDQIIADRGTPNERVTSVMNIVREQGGWASWKKTLSSQFLSKQKPLFAKTQLEAGYEQHKKNLDEILALTNPTIKKQLLEYFANEADSAAVHLQAAKMNRQNWHAILPLEDMREDQIYAPNYKPGEKVILIRHPHGGTFEIPELTVNNRHPSGIRLIGPDAEDAVGINAAVAKRLSGADFDGDTVLVIPNNQRRIQTTKALDALKDFDTKRSFPPYDGMRTIDGGTWDAKQGKVVFAPGQQANTTHMQTEMGKISNLITDMTIKAAPIEHISRAVRHSMVIIDSEKHSLDYRSSYRQHGIKELKQEYQVREGGKFGGASTLISRAKSRVDVPERKARLASEGGPINPVTGALEFVPTGRAYPSKRTGQRELATERSTQLREAGYDARKLSSGTPMETIYAEHSNKLTALANQARLEMLNTPNITVSKSAKKVYAEEVASLEAKLNKAKRNQPLERQANTIANVAVKAIREANPGLNEKAVGKIKNQQLEIARVRVGAMKKDKIIQLTDKEWDAIQAGAISNTQLQAILRNTDIEDLRRRATPKALPTMTPTRTTRAIQMLESGYTRSEVAELLGVSLSTMDRAIKDRKEGVS